MDYWEAVKHLANGEEVIHSFGENLKTGDIYKLVMIGGERYLLEKNSYSVKISKNNEFPTSGIYDLYKVEK